MLVAADLETACDGPPVSSGWSERNRRGVAQSVAHVLWEHEVVGSSPAAPTTSASGTTATVRARAHARAIVGT